MSFSMTINANSYCFYEQIIQAQGDTCNILFIKYHLPNLSSQGILLIKKLTVAYLVQKFPAIYFGKRRFIVSTKFHHCNLSLLS